jgi:hypothetical protein
MVSLCEEWVRDIISSIAEIGGFVDANCLSFLWPKELNPFRICFISGALTNPIFSVFCAEDDGKEKTEIIIRCDGSHFTLLKPIFVSGHFKVLSICSTN